jgi:hypothetical protein
MNYEPVRNKPVAKFFYKGHHTHPVRRTVLVIKSDRNIIVGYELREGRVLRSIKKAPIKSYRRDRIAIARQLRVDNLLRQKNAEASTYQRDRLLAVLIEP